MRNGSRSTFVPYYGPPPPNYMQMDQIEYPNGHHQSAQPYNMDRLRVDSRKGAPNQQLLISPMKFVSPRRDTAGLYQEAMAD